MRGEGPKAQAGPYVNHTHLYGMSEREHDALIPDPNVVGRRRLKSNSQCWVGALRGHQLSVSGYMCLNDFSTVGTTTRIDLNDNARQGG